jgi:hypothetical protein
MNEKNNENTRKNNWLMEYKKNITSIRGEDGILRKIFEIIKGDKWCVEFGAGDGKSSSNTWNFIVNEGWSAVLIEADKKEFISLIKTYEKIKRAICLNKFINFTGSDSIDDILSDTSIPQSFDLISIDIDGNDYHIWKSIKKFEPKVVIIEFNPSFPNHVEFIQARNFKVKQGSSILSIVKLGKIKGYELVAVTDINAIFVRKEFFELFKIKDNSLPNIRDDNKYRTYLYQLFDGTILVDGYKNLIWHGKEIKYKNMQILPRYLRKYPGDYPLIIKYWMKLKRIIRRILKIE